MTRSAPMRELERMLAGESRLVLLAFLHDGCEPCRELGPQLHVLAEAAADVCRVVVVDATIEEDIARRYRVTTFPTLVFVKQGHELQRVKGGALPATTLAALERTSDLAP
ncbi:MAG: thioredoxin family protein [Candidatus Dormiibacterota bacterium]